VAGAAEHDRPGLTDQAAADQRDSLHGASPDSGQPPVAGTIAAPIPSRQGRRPGKRMFGPRYRCWSMARAASAW